MARFRAVLSYGHQPTTTHQFSVSFHSRNRKDVRDQILALGGEYDSRMTVITKIPAMYYEKVKEILEEAYPDGLITEIDRRPCKHNDDCRIAWANTGEPWDSRIGYVGGIWAFSTRYNTSGRSPKKEETYQVTSRLPGITPYEREPVTMGATREEAELAAEAALSLFLSKLGATLTD